VARVHGQKSTGRQEVASFLKGLIGAARRLLSSSPADGSFFIVPVAPLFLIFRDAHM
jgi:hypothetical protein